MMPIRAMRSPLSRKFAIIIAYFFAGSKQNREIRWTSGANRRTMGEGTSELRLHAFQPLLQRDLVVKPQTGTNLLLHIVRQVAQRHAEFAHQRQRVAVGRAIVRINPITNGEVLFKGRRITGKISRELDNEVIRSCQMIFQDPMASLNERAKVDYIVSEGIINYHLYKDNKDRVDKVQHALEEVGLLPEFSSRFPHEFSGGQRQRIGIARSLIMQPEFIVADEPISALDVSIRAQVLNLLNEMKKTRGLTYLFIAHDLSVVRFISDRIAVISKGRIVELAEAEELFLHPLHPYTKALLSAVPIPDPGLEKKKKLLVYDPSCHDYSVDKPVWEEIANGHFVYGNQKELEGYRKEYQSQL